MAYQVVAVRMSGGTEHEHIAGVAIVWEKDDSYKAKTEKINTAISCIKSGQQYFTRDWAGEEADVVVVGTGSSAYIRTKKDGVMRDNLLRLPRYD